MARAIWSGSVSFGLVSVPVKLFSAVQRHTIRFKQLHRDTHARVRRKRVDAETGDEVPYDDIVKGYEIADGRYVVVEPEELDALAPDASRQIAIEDFVAIDEIDPLFYDRPYYLGPDGEAAGKPYRLLAEAMERTGRVAIARFVMRGNEHLAAIRAKDGVLVANTMHHADEVRDAGSIEGLDAADVDVSERELEMAEQLIESLVTTFDPEQYPDEYHERVQQFLEEKAEGREVTLPETGEERGEVIDLMEALERSLEGAGHQARPTPASDGYTEMSKAELYELAQERDIEGRSQMTKGDLVEALRAADQAGQKAS